jgi:hypothetical protein
MDEQIRDLLIESRRAILRADHQHAIRCIDLVLKDSRTDRLKRAYERLGMTSALVVKKKYGRRSTFGYIRE